MNVPYGFAKDYLILPYLEICKKYNIKPQEIAIYARKCGLCAKDRRNMNL